MTAAPLWRLHDVRIVVPARAVSMLGDAVLAIVLLLHVQAAGLGVWPVVMLLAVEVVPPVLLIGVAGHVADTYDSKLILMAATGAQTAACVALAFAPNLSLVFALFLVIQVGQAFTGPTWTALMPRVVGEDRIGRYVAFQSGLAAFAGPLGAGLGGALFGLAGMRTAVLIDAVTFALLLVAATLVRTRRGGSEGERSAAPARIRTFAGFSVIRRDPIVWPMMWALVATIVTIGGVNVVDVFLVRDSLHTSAALYGLSEVVAAIGGAVGSVIAARSAVITTQVRVAFAGFAVIGLGCVGAGLAPNFVVYLVFATMIGLANTAVNATFGAVLIRRTAEADRGKAAASLNGLAQVGMLSALLLGGTAGQVFGPRGTFVAAGIAAIAVALGAIAVAYRSMSALEPK
ncbi:MFS transporter [Streptosporangiaceae bacterium NEAU-GS5]|nr:MFS transporter [Streptosporangiaceae bacterium NEAU-GS5]